MPAAAGCRNLTAAISCQTWPSTPPGPCTHARGHGSLALLPVYEVLCVGLSAASRDSHHGAAGGTCPRCPARASPDCGPACAQTAATTSCQIQDCCWSPAPAGRPSSTLPAFVPSTTAVSHDWHTPAASAVIRVTVTIRQPTALEQLPVLAAGEGAGVGEQQLQWAQAQRKEALDSDPALLLILGIPRAYVQNQECKHAEWPLRSV